MAEAIDFKNPAGKPSGVLEYLEGRRLRAQNTLQCVNSAC